MRRLSIFLTLVLLTVGLTVAQTTPPDVLNYQGVLRDASDAPLDGTYPMLFRFFDAAASGNEILVDSHAAVVVSGGLFSVQLGSGTVTDGSGPGAYTTLSRVFANYPDLYVEVEVGGETLSPRIRVASAGYALNTRYVRGMEIVSDGPLDLYVDGTSGVDGNDGLSPTTAKRTIQAAINEIPRVLTDAVTVHIADGTYSEEVVLNRRQRQGLHWISIEGNPGSPQSVVFDGLGVLDLGLFIHDSLVQIKGITFSDFIDAAVQVIGASLGATFSDCRFTNNVGDGALYSENSQEVVIRDCEFLNNSTAISAHNSSVFIEGNCVISNNGPRPAVNISGGSLSVDVEAGSCTITGNSGTGVRVSSQGSLGLDNGPLEVSNNGRGVECTSGSHVSFGGRADVTAMNNTGGDLIANYQSTIRGYGNGTTGGCTADTHSTCEP